MRDVLEKAGHRVTVRHDGSKGLTAHLADPADLLITDLVMPGMEGIEAIAQFRRRHPALKIIAMSGGGLGRSGSYLEVAKGFGVNATLPKPFTVPRLLETVTGILGGTPAESAPRPDEGG
jgi:CheY-like chemotaxis protein